MTYGEIFLGLVKTLGLLAVYFALLTYVGGTLLFKGLQKAEVPEITRRRCLRNAFIAATYAFIALMVLGMILHIVAPGPIDAMTLRVLQLGVFLGVQLVLIPLLFKKYSRQVLLVEIGAILVSNIITFAVVLFLVQA